MEKKIYQKISYGEMREKLSLILMPEKSFYIAAVIYGLGVSALTLAVPISVQALVNSVAFTGLTQPLIVLSLVLFALLAFSGCLNALQTYITELFQRHFYARMGSEIAITLLNANYKELEKRNGMELVNRYFDVMTIQKSLTNLLIGGSAVALQTFAGLLLLGFYHPYFLGFDILLLLLLIFMWLVYGKAGVNTAVKESSAKYRMAYWLEELARANLFFKEKSRKEKALKISNEKIQDYIGHRKNHFKYLFRQIIFLLCVYAFMSSMVLGLGGYLVIKGQLTLGQLVAAELVATLILGGFAKSGKYLESFYDLYAAVEKLSHFYEISREKESTQRIGEMSGVFLDFAGVVASYGHSDFCYHHTFEPGKKYLIHTHRYSSQLMFLNLCQGLIKPNRGRIRLGGVSYEELSQVEIKEYLHVVDSPLVIKGTILDNLTFGDESFSYEELREVLELVGLSHLETDLPGGLNTELSSNGLPLWSTQLVRIELARVLLKKPKIVVITEVLNQLEETSRKNILNEILKNSMTALIFNDKALPQKFDAYLFYGEKEIQKFSSLDGLAKCGDIEKGEDHA